MSPLPYNQLAATPLLLHVRVRGALVPPHRDGGRRGGLSRAPHGLPGSPSAAVCAAGCRDRPARRAPSPPARCAAEPATPVPPGTPGPGEEPAGAACAQPAGTNGAAQGGPKATGGHGHGAGALGWILQLTCSAGPPRRGREVRVGGSVTTSPNATVSEGEAEPGVRLGGAAAALSRLPPVPPVPAQPHLGAGSSPAKPLASPPSSSGLCPASSSETWGAVL